MLDTEDGSSFTAIPDMATASGVSAIPAQVEAAILDEGDATALLAAIAAKVEAFINNDGDAAATLVSIATAVNTAIIAGSIGTNVAAAKTAAESTATLLDELTEDDGSGNNRYTTKALEQAPGGGSMIENTVVISAASVAATAASNSGELTITRYSSFAVEISGLGDLTDRTGLVWTMKPGIKTLKSTTDAQALLQITEDDGLLIVNGEAADDSALGSLEVISEATGKVRLEIDETICGELASGMNFPYSVKKLIAGGAPIELTSVDYPRGAKTVARVLEAVTRAV